MHCDSSIPLILSHSILPYIYSSFLPSLLSPPPIDRHTLHRHRQSDIHFSSFLPFIKTSPAAPESLHAQLGIYAWYFRTRPEANTHTTKAHTALEPESEAARRHLFNPLQYRNDDASLTVLCRTESGGTKGGRMDILVKRLYLVGPISLLAECSACAGLD